MLNRYQGDPLLSIEENGIDIPFFGGQPIMDRGLTNAVLNSLFIPKGYILSKLIGCEGLEGSDFLHACNKTTTVSNLNEVRQRAEKALSSIDGTKEIFVSNPSGNKKEILIRIKPPGENKEKTIEFLFTKKGIYWYYQLLVE